MKYIMATAIGLGLCAVHPAKAASFDCLKATSPTEKIICANPDLSAEDEVLDKLYRDALSKLSENAQQAVRDSQRQWLKYVANVCSAARLRKDRTSIQCLTNEYENRHKQLSSAVQISGDVVIYEVNIFRESAVKDASDRYGHHPGSNTVEVSYPQIDSPKNAHQSNWNRQIAVSSRKDMKAEQGTDWVWGYELGVVTPTLISIQAFDYMYGHRAPHGLNGTNVINWSVEREREVKATDFFSSSTLWPQALARICAQDLKKKVFSPELADENRLIPMVIEADRWTFTKDSLVIGFRGFEMGGGVNAADYSVTIPYRSMEPYYILTYQGGVPKPY